MASKKSFILYNDNAAQINLLTDEQAGKLIKRLFVFSQTGEKPNFNDAALEMCFSFIAQQIERDTEAYAKKCKQLSQNARNKKSQAEPNASNCIQMLTNASNCNQIEGDNDNVNVNDTVTVNVNDTPSSPKLTAILEQAELDGLAIEEERDCYRKAITGLWLAQSRTIDHTTIPGEKIKAYLAHITYDDVAEVHDAKDFFKLASPVAYLKTAILRQLIDNYPEVQQ